MARKIRNLFLFSLVTTVVSAFVLMGRSAGAAVIYVDTGHGSTSAYQTGSNWANVRNGGGTTSNLVDINNVATSVDITLSAGSASATSGDMPAVGTDAYNLFNGFLNADGVTSINSDNGTIGITFSNLDVNATYDVAMFGNRINTNANNNEDNPETFEISGADAFTNVSSTGTIINASTTAFDTRNNDATGFIARWTGVSPGIDGQFSITLKDGNKINYLNAIRLESVAPPAVPEPTSILLCLIGSIGLVVVMRRVRKRGA